MLQDVGQIVLKIVLEILLAKALRLTHDEDWLVIHLPVKSSVLGLLLKFQDLLSSLVEPKIGAS